MILQNVVLSDQKITYDTTFQTTNLHFFVHQSDSWRKYWEAPSLKKSTRPNVPKKNRKKTASIPRSEMQERQSFFHLGSQERNYCKQSAESRSRWALFQRWFTGNKEPRLDGTKEGLTNHAFWKNTLRTSTENFSTLSRSFETVKLIFLQGSRHFSAATA